MRAIVVLTLLVVLRVGLFAGEQGGVERAREPLQVATVNGVAVKKTVVAQEVVVTIFRIRHGRDPETADDEREMISEQQQMECRDFRQHFYDTIQADEIKKRGISVSDEELDERAREMMKGREPEAEAARLRDLSAARVAALREVYERGADPEQTYARYLAGRGVTESEWRGDLATGRTSEARALIERGTLVTGAMLRAPTRNLRGQMEVEKMDAAIDRELANGDPVFARFLAESQRKGSMSVDHIEYLTAKRREWWKARYGELNVVVVDRQLADRCRLAALGIHID